MPDLFSPVIEWIRSHPAALWWSGAVSLAMFVGTLVVVPVLLVKMPENYFTRETDEELDDWRGRHPVLRWVGRIGKNLLGIALVLLGVALLVLPGQGLLTVLLGITLLDLPGKRRLEARLLRHRGLSRAVNWLRRKYGRAPLKMPARPSTVD